jgi:hypothetical protein
MTKLRNIFFSALAVAGTLNVSCGRSIDQTSDTNEAWDQINDPMRLGSGYEYRLQFLPTGGNAAVTPWTDTYWPSNQGGISSRWVANQSGFSYQFLTRDQVLSLTPAQLASLSPAEKYDILNGRYDFPLTVSERQRTNPNVPGWHGLCHGWAPAAVNYYEPKSVVVRSAEGLEIPFGASDVKALLTYYQGQAARTQQYVLGARCDIDLRRNPQAALLPQCRDVNAGAFHVIVSNFLGRSKRAFLADVTRDEQVWNQPVHAYATQVQGYRAPSRGAAFGSVQEAVVTTTIYYTSEVAPQWQALTGTAGHRNDSKTYTYTVELNGFGQVIGGQWLTEERPDFLWLQPAETFSGYFANLATVYNAAVTSSGIEFPRQ